MTSTAQYSNSKAGSSDPSSSSIFKPKLSRIHVSNQYIFQAQLQNQLDTIGTTSTREENFRLLGIQWISDTRQALQLPVRTFCTAATYYHKFRLIHKDSEYHYQDAAAGALLTACKIEDTLKKSKEIICAAHNLKIPPSENLSPDDSIFEGHSKIVIGLERLMLEASGFDFRVRYPQKHLVKIAKEICLEKSIYVIAYDIMIDLYRTFAPLKQTSATMTFACLELATLIMDQKKSSIYTTYAASLYKRCSTTRAEILETILDLLDLYTHFQKSSIIGPLHHIDKFIQIRISLNQEMEQDPSLDRFTGSYESLKTNGVRKTPRTPITPASPSDIRKNGSAHANPSPVALSPRSADSGRRSAATRGQDITIRFMLDADRAKKEKEVVSEYFKPGYEEYEVEVEEPLRPSRVEWGTRGSNRGREDRYYHNSNKRARR